LIAEGVASQATGRGVRLKNMGRTQARR